MSRHGGQYACHAAQHSETSTESTINLCVGTKVFQAAKEEVDRDAEDWE